MTNTTSINSIFSSAMKGAEASREFARKCNTFTCILDVKDSFRLLLNEANNKMKFVMYKKPNKEAVATAEQELEVMKAEYELADEDESSEHMQLQASAIYKLEKRIEGLMNTEMELEVRIDSEGKEFTQKELETIAYTIANSNPYGEPVLFGKYGVLYNLGLPMVITKNKVKIISSIDAVCNIQCSEKFSDFQAKQLDKQPMPKAAARSYVEDSEDALDDAESLESLQAMEMECED